MNNLDIRLKSIWNVSTFFIGLSMLIVGSFYYKAPDWDIPVSIIMASVTYLTAQFSFQVFIKRIHRLYPISLFYVWLSVDGLYAIYWWIVDPVALEHMREANFWASLSLYMMCGIIWSLHLFLETTKNKKFLFFLMRN